MYKKIITDYVKKMNLNDILDFANKENIKISNNDAITLLSYIKKYYNEILDGNEEIFKEIKNKIDINTYREAYKLYIKYKIKYF